MKMLTVQLDNDRNVSINCDQILYVMEKHIADQTLVVMAAGDMLSVKMPYLELVGFLKAID